MTDDTDVGSDVDPDSAAGRRIGVDVGGTFTDVVTLSTGELAVGKTPSTPAAPEEGVVTGVEKVSDREGFAPETVTYFGHGTTVATNAVLEGEWAETALVTTAGFRDALEIGRQNRPDIYDFRAEKPTPIVERDRRFEAKERVDERGRVLDPLSTEEARALAERVARTGVDSVAVCLLFSFENDDHERQLVDAFRAVDPDLSVSASSVVLPEIREYERTLSTALNAALLPVINAYIGALDRKIRDLGVTTDLRVMGSNGGIMAADAARERPVDTLLSGPAAGVRGATYVAGLAGISDLVTMDMGGTSCDVSLVEAGDPVVSTDVEVGAYPVGVPMVDVHTVGAGGGSIAYLDAGDALRVGPRSAGADPGPVCYGRGGEDPTITDAHLLLGRLSPEQFLSGELDVEVDDVRRAVETRVAAPLDRSVEGAAQGILDVANANMERALRVVSVERGYDPREFALVAFGGAGPLHAPVLAEALDVPRVLVPRTAGVLSALGLLVSDVVYDDGRSMVRRWTDVDHRDLVAAFADLRDRGRERLDGEGIDPDRRSYERTIDLRYVGQSFDLSIPVPDTLDAAAMNDLRERFHETHRRRYGHADPEEPLELVTLRLRARGHVDPPDLHVEDPGTTVEDAIIETRRVVFDGHGRDTRVYDRQRLPPEGGFDGPAVVEGPESTVAVPPGQSVRVDEYGNLVVEVAA